MKLKTIFLTGIFTLFLVSGLWAQDKYEYAIVKYVPNQNSTYTIYLSKNDGFTEEKGGVDNGARNFVGLVKFMESLSMQGWEVFATTQESSVIFYHLRKKKN